MNINVGRKAVTEASEKLRNWGRWGKDDQIGTLNHIMPEDIVRRGQADPHAARSSRSASRSDRNGPQRGLFGKRWNPIHTMLATGTDALAGRQTGLHPLRRRCDQHADAGGHALGFAGPHLLRRQDVQRASRPRGRLQRVSASSASSTPRTSWWAAACCSTSPASRASTALKDGEGISNDELDACAKAQKVEIRKRRFRHRAHRARWSLHQAEAKWGGYAGGDAPGLKFESCYWLQEKQVGGVCSDTWGVEVRPNETKDVNQPWHWVVIPAMGLYMGEMFDLKELAEDCAADKRLRVLLLRRAAGHPRRHRLADQSAGDQVADVRRARRLCKRLGRRPALRERNKRDRLPDRPEGLP